MLSMAADWRGFGACLVFLVPHQHHAPAMATLEQLRAVEHPEEEVEDLSNPEVFNKYKAAADVANGLCQNKPCRFGVCC